ncbi:MAG: hypothetical protein QJR08_00360 [Bacillota bacterium]|nr:hypothetical protein [Bacillota bacterium]
MKRKLVAAATALAMALAVVGGVLPFPVAAAEVAPDVIITSWSCIGGIIGECEFYGQTSNGGRVTIPATFDPSAVKGVPNLTQPDNVQALVAAMQAKDWSSAHGGYDKFSPDLEARFKAAGININWVYQRLYTPMNPGDVLAPWVPTTPQPVYLNGKGPVAQPPKPQPAQKPPVVTQSVTPKAQVPSGQAAPAAKAPAAKAPAAGVGQAPAQPPRTLDEARRQQEANVVIAVKPSPGAPPILVPGAYTSQAWIQAHEAEQRIQASERRDTALLIAGAAAAALLAAFALFRWRRGLWPFRPRWA